MGSIWLRDLPDVISSAGLRVRTWPGWENRARSSGGYDAVYAVFAHHTASSTSPDNDCSYMWDATGGDQPIGALYLDRTGLVTVGAAGATNTQGKGGPWTLSRGTIPLDKGNAYGIAVEAANNGTGEQWPTAQTDAYTALCAALCAAYKLSVKSDVLSHFEWVEPSCPSRKIDPAGPSPWAVGTATWNMDWFRDDAAEENPDPGPTPTPPTTGDDDEMLYLMKAKDTPDIYLGDGNTCSVLTPEAFDAIGDLMDQGVTHWHHPHRAGFPLINDRTEVASMAKARMLGVMGKQIVSTEDINAAAAETMRRMYSVYGGTPNEPPAGSVGRLVNVETTVNKIAKKVGA